MNRNSATLRVRNWSLPVSLALICSGCPVVTSQRTNWQAPDRDGVSYYLPKKNVLVTMTVPEDDKTPSFEVTETAAFPDTTHRFIANYHQSWIGNDTLSIGVTSAGLLTSTNADFQSQLPTILENLAKSAGAFGLPAAPERPPEQPECLCKKKGVYKEQFSVDEEDLNGPDGPYTKPQTAICGYKVTIKPVYDVRWKGAGLKAFDGCIAEDPCPKWIRHCSGQAGKARCGTKACPKYPGLFYRQAEPYIVTIDGAQCGPVGRTIVFSPSNAPLELLTVKRGLFANANTTFKFVDGSLESYQQTKASELSALTALPADLAKSYFESVGSMFDWRTKAVNNQASYEKAIAALLLQQAKTQACTAALAAGDTAAVEANCK